MKEQKGKKQIYFFTASYDHIYQGCH